ncbi:hypothetical protein [Streptomyces brasiliensis]|uniref:DUF5666 domain-containing protein n=1 Tax=Streptomyces brasiliensis TaxID=1954 RepID=A0A917KBV2_9ACTN|nr:hypothetical protein [Streptomyces brasiliensis]GGJ06026.1 hypothetical protein GCM10010121_015530 [Streptomyces brasiliensis]
MHEPDHEQRSGEGPTEPVPPIPPMPAEPPRAAAEWEVIAGPGDGRESRPPLRERWHRQSARARAVTVAVAVVVLALGGTVAYAAASGGTAGDAVPAAAGSTSPSPGPDGHGHGSWFGLGGDAAHGEATVKDRDTGKWVVRVWQRGTVEKVAGDQVTVKSEDGARWTWTVGSDAMVRRHDVSSDSGTLKKGDTAILVGTRADDGTRTAKAAFAGTFDGKGSRFDGKGPREHRGGLPGHGPWGRPDGTPSPAGPSGSGATT